MTPSVPAPPPATEGTHSDRETLIESKTRSLIFAASRGDFDLASRDFDDTMRKGFPPSTFSTTWATLESQAGKFQAVASIALKKKGSYWTDSATCAFEHASLVLNVTYDADQRVAGFHVAAVESQATWAPPPYAKPDLFEEHAVTVGTAHPLPGVLTLPRKGGPAPIVVLVHGSGPADADESVGGAKVFKDLAWGLASRGIAVLRYVKRTRQDPSGVVTSKEEVLDGAHDAIELARHTDGIDKHRVFVLGHSQGGYLAPRIARDNPGLAGAIILAGSTQPIQDTAIDQVVYLSSLPGAPAQLSAMLPDLRQSKRAIEDPGLKADDDVTFLGGSLKGAYFLDLRGYDPAAVAKQLDTPLLVLQGGRDYQVTMKELEGWRAALATRKTASLKVYPSLNHLFVAGEGAPSPAEYEKPGHVELAVIEDIAGWVVRK